LASSVSATVNVEKDMGETSIPFTFWKNENNEYTPRKFDCKTNSLGQDEIFKFNNDQSELILVF